jgi:hypothetical protein
LLYLLLIGNKDEKKILKRIGYLFATLLLSIFVVFSLDYQPKIPLKSLLVNAPLFPTQWNNKFNGVVTVQWMLTRDTFSSQQGAGFASTANLGRTWNNGDSQSTPQIIQQIFKYRHSIVATIGYFVSKPEIIYSHKWPNFTFKGNYQHRYPSNWNYKSTRADQEHIVCAMGHLDSCQLWFYWTRYGQYILEVRFFAPNEGMDSDTFAKITEQIDTYITNQFKSAR